jgi:FkbM family methyltransferase
MGRQFSRFSLQWVKDRIIESGAERWARPLAMKLTGKRPARYDVELSSVIGRVLKLDSTFIDIGAHRGLILDVGIRHALQGTFHAFEPLPYLAKLLRRKYHGNSHVKLYELALSDTVGTTTFYIDKASMGLSAPLDRDSRSAEVETCTVTLARLDDLLPEAWPDMIKIDVEGAELGVLRGALKLLARSRPVVAFEHGLGGANRFGTLPEDVFDLFADLDL